MLSLKILQTQTEEWFGIFDFNVIEGIKLLENNPFRLSQRTKRVDGHPEDVDDQQTRYHYGSEVESEPCDCDRRHCALDSEGCNCVSADCDRLTPSEEAVYDLDHYLRHDGEPSDEESLHSPRLQFMERYASEYITRKRSRIARFTIATASYGIEHDD
ncbi:uncharacterized protein KY384_002868 [Bacidia gigantensis]|uniref:uncharacterized protein n=1 Tax=Bacidia gigantensis TaxID=2732470 RepID=UPI001D0366D9|nr:uncharacterized protein KY384_002868 [Bacidia gigantensis]KAG8532383.1 hypothetical protein KY384_002868 [Bacidia gigantensis]